MKWPFDGSPYWDWREMIRPLVAAMKRIEAGKAPRYNGLDTPSRSHAALLQHEAETGDRDYRETIIGIAIQLGIEQGMRMERIEDVEAKRRADVMDRIEATLKLMKKAKKA